MSSPKASGGLNPEMVYRPVSSPSITPGANTSYLRIDESEDPKYRLRVRLTWIVRFVFAWLTFGALLGFMISTSIGGSRRFTVPLFCFLWFVLIWHLFLLFPKLSRGGRGIARLLPRISLQIGDAACVLGGDDDNNRDRDRGDYPGGPPAKKKLSTIIATVIDFLYGVALIVLGALWCTSPCGYYSTYQCYRWSHRHLPSVVVSIILGSFMIVASFFSIFKVYHTIAFELSVYKDGTVRPISLGNPDADVSARREPVSISA